MIKAESKQDPSAPAVAPVMLVADVATPALAGWLDDLAHAADRVQKGADPEAIHDLRVSIRRIRSLLRDVRDVYGSFHVTQIRALLKEVADATGDLRDDEVLVETMRELDLQASHRKALVPWMRERASREKSLRTAVVKLLKTGALAAPMSQLRALLTLPCKPGRNKDARRFARSAVLRAQSRVDALRLAEVHDVQAMHNLRIAYKRLRYTAEAFSSVLPPELRSWVGVAAKFQKVLGSLHDHDVALDVVRASKTIPAATLRVVDQAVLLKRGAFAQSYLELIGPAFVPSRPPPAPVKPVEPSVAIPTKSAKTQAPKTVKKTREVSSRAVRKATRTRA